jgi:chorismate mutase
MPVLLKFAELHAVRDQIHAVDRHLAGALDRRAAALTRGVAVLIALWSVAAALILLPPG